MGGRGGEGRHRGTSANSNFLGPVQGTDSLTTDYNDHNVDKNNVATGSTLL